MAARTVDFYFDYISGYAYFGWLRIEEVCASRGVGLRLHPVLFAGLLNHWGTVGPAEVPPRRAWVYRDGFRYAALHGIPLRCPRFHPYNPLPSLRMSLAGVAGDDQARVVRALFHAGWTDGIDLGSADELVAALDAAGLDGKAILARSEGPSAKEALKRATASAIGRGVFGVPTMLCGEELFWGNDRIDHLELHLDGRDPLDPHRGQVQEILARARMADRPGKGGRA